MFGRLRRAERESLVAVLRVLGAPVNRAEDAPEAVRAFEAAEAGRVVEPVTVAWADGPVRVQTRAGPAECTLLLESGEERSWRATGPMIDVPGEVPLGYHRLHVAGAATTIIRAPRAAPTAAGHRDWGVFLPVYAIRSARDWGCGDLTDLETLATWVREHGGNLVATLPLSAAFLDEPFEPSPYSPVSRLFYNELYCDPARLPEFGAAREVVDAPGFRSDVEALRTGHLVDYRGSAALRRRVMEPMARAYFAGDTRELDAELAARPELDDYARFRGACRRYAGAWQAFPEPARDGSLRPEDVDPDEYRYHVYAQWSTARQIRELADRMEGAGSAMYFDLPLGVDGGGYDVWRHREHFALGVSGGAPPDTFFRKGQNWGFPPLHPHASRERGHAYFAACVRHLVGRAQILRIDHVMGFHRLFWIPDGMTAAQGVYVRSHPEELYAICALEAQRSGAVVVGEDLGTVTREVRTAMREHGVLRNYVLQYEAGPESISPVPEASLATLNTHDMVPFAGFWNATDLDRLEKLGFFEPEEASEEHKRREETRRTLAARLSVAGDGEAPIGPLLRAALGYLAGSDARAVVVDLENLWEETDPQNVPGTTEEYPNWRRKAQLTLEELRQRPEVADQLDEIERLRNRGEHPMTDKRSERRRPPRDPAGGSQAPARTVERQPRTRISGPSVRDDVSLLTPDDIYLFNEGTHGHLHRKLGSHLAEAPDGTPGTYFAVWAPNASAISVVGDFNTWEPGSHRLRTHGSSGIWEGFVPGLGNATLYKYHVVSSHNAHTQDKIDPFAMFFEVPPKTASIVWDMSYEWDDGGWMASRGPRNALDAPMSTYEVHLGSWMHAPEVPESLSYRDLAPKLADHLERMNYTHVEFMPVMEHPFYGSWGYQCTGFFAPSSRFGTPQDFMYLVDHLHQRGFGVILDWVPSHFPTDAHALGFFDGTHLYEHADPKLGIHPDWQSYIFNYGRNEVRSFLLSSAMHWLETFHADGLRVDAVASMLYLDYSREAGEWIPNEFGGRENLRAIDFLRQLNHDVYGDHPDVQTIAEESTAWPGVSKPTYVGGLGFGLKWDMGWMHDTLQYFSHDPIHRRYHHNQLTFRAVYAFHENFVMPLSHDEVVHGKGSLIGKMPGDEWQRFANLRALYGYMYGQPGKKLLFMGGEIGQYAEWDHNGALDWHLLSYPLHEGLRAWVEDLNRAYRTESALHELDCDAAGFEWVDANDAEGSTLSFLRKDRAGRAVLVLCNLTPVPHNSYRVGVPVGGYWRELLNSDAERYGGSGVGNFGGVEAVPIPLHGRPKSLTLALPPLSVLFLKPEAE